MNAPPEMWIVLDCRGKSLGAYASLDEALRIRDWWDKHQSSGNPHTMHRYIPEGHVADAVAAPPKTLRDEFAMAVLAVAGDALRGHLRSQAADECYWTADEMLRARERNKP